MDPLQQPQPPISPTPEQPQPQPVAQPVAPTPPVAPQPVQPAPFVPAGTQPAPAWGAAPVQTAPMQPQSSASGGNKKLIILIASIAGGLLILGVAAAILIGFFTVSKKDYSAALSQYNDLASANYTLNSKLSSVQYGVDSTTDTSFSNDMDAAKKALAEVKTENEKLSKLKAVSIGEGNTKYKAFSAKLDTYLAYTNDLLTSLGNMRDAAVTCDDSSSDSSSVSAIKAGIDACVEALDKVSDVPDADVKAFIVKIKDEYTNLSSVVGSLSAIKDPYGTQYDQYKSLRDQMYSISDNISNAQTDFQSNLEKHADAADPKSAADEFSKYLEDKAAS